MAETVVLGTSACFAFLQDEPGAEVVEAFLVEAREGQRAVHASFVTLSEVKQRMLPLKGAAGAGPAT